MRTKTSTVTSTKTGTKTSAKISSEISTVTSRDGTVISYRTLGRGPGVVVLHGMMQAGHSQLELAEALSGSFTCHLPDRRGRGRSGPYGDYSVEREVEDLDALLTATGAERVIGVSAGAIITLRTALVQPALRKAVIFDPPLDLDGSTSSGWLPRFDREIAEGRTAAALVTAMLAIKMGPPVFNVLPRGLLEFVTGRMLAAQDRGGAGDEPTFRELAPTVHYDAQVVAETARSLDDYRDVRAEVLLLGGAKSPAYMKEALDALERVLPHATRTRLPGLGHNATSNADFRGAPAKVAEAVRPFLA
ncbi:alpha/beta hydrolase [Nonomuraea sp. NPDC000554]|uniref:alpha/beta fold hydrolase n=1 Tax=Nonomuraea sp. NPDC000554 TaxID=3154259 RepID=UPI00331A72A9